MRRTTAAVLSIALAALLGALCPAVASAVDGTSTTTHTIVPDTPTGANGWYAETTPTLTITRIGGGLTIYGAGGHRISIESSDAVIQPPVEEGDQAYYYYAIDPAGNAEVPAHIIFGLMIDTVPPVTSDDARAVYHGAALITLTAADPVPGSGVIADDIFWSLDGLPSAGPIVTTSLPGQHTLGYASVDVAGNREVRKFVSFEVTDSVEPTPTTSHTVVPTVPSGAAGWYVATPTVTVFRTGDGVTYFGAGGHPVWLTSTQAAFDPPLEEGGQAYTYFAVGSDGTTESPTHLFGLKLDTRPPVTTDDAVATYTATAAITLSAADPVPGSGVAVTSWTLDGVAGSGPLVVTSADGTHTLRYSSIDVAGNRGALRSVSFEVTTTPVEPPSSSETTRVGGADRYEVARNLALATFSDPAAVRDVVIACGSDRSMADPLSAAGLAGLYDAPLLLVRNDTREVVPPATIAALTAMRAGGPLAIHVVGGLASVTAGHERILRSFGTIDRIGGADRYAVAAGVAARMRARLGGTAPSKALVVNGNMPAYFFDALVASPVAARRHIPILLVKNGSIPPATAGALVHYKTRYVIGGLGAVNAATYTQAAGTTRLGGADRTEVAAAVAAFFTSSGDLAWTDVGVAANLSDSLAGGAALGTLGGPLLLTDPANLSAATAAAIAAHASAIDTLHIVGGAGSVTPAVEAQLRAALGL